MSLDLGFMEKSYSGRDIIVIEHDICMGKNIVYSVDCLDPNYSAIENLTI